MQYQKHSLCNISNVLTSGTKHFLMLMQVLCIDFIDLAEVKDVVYGNSDMLKTFKKNLLFQKCQWTFIHKNTCLSNLASSRVCVLNCCKLCGDDISLTQQDCIKGLSTRTRFLWDMVTF